MLHLLDVRDSDNHVYFARIGLIREIFGIDSPFSIQALEAFDDYYTGKDDNGAVLFIYKDNTVIGITGWYTLSSKYIGLRWTGIATQHRGNGYCREALQLLKRQLAMNGTHGALVETAITAGAMRYFQNIGFYKSSNKKLITVARNESGCGDGSYVLQSYYEDNVGPLRIPAFIDIGKVKYLNLLKPNQSRALTTSYWEDIVYERYQLISPADYINGYIEALFLKEIIREEVVICMADRVDKNVTALLAGISVETVLTVHDMESPTSLLVYLHHDNDHYLYASILVCPTPYVTKISDSIKAEINNRALKPIIALEQ